MGVFDATVFIDRGCKSLVEYVLSRFETGPLERRLVQVNAGWVRFR